VGHKTLVYLTIILLVLCSAKLFSKVVYYAGVPVTGLVIVYRPSLQTILYEGKDGNLHANNGTGRKIAEKYHEVFAVEEETFGWYLWIFDRFFIPLLIGCLLAMAIVGLRLWKRART
jgi:hypothetical protein